MSPRIPITPEVAEKMRQFQVVAKVAVQTGVSHIGSSRDRSSRRISALKIGMEHFGLTRDQATVCLARAQVSLSNWSDSMSSETLVIAARRRQLKVLKPAA